MIGIGRGQETIGRGLVAPRSVPGRGPVGPPRTAPFPAPAGNPWLPRLLRPRIMVLGAFLS